MSHVPIGSQALGQDPFGAGIVARYPGGLVPQGISVELIAARWGLSRQVLDAFAAQSHRRAAAARALGRFAAEVAPLKVLAPDGALGEVTADESVRAGTSAEVLAGLRPAFRAAAWEQRFPQIEWRVTAGNSSPVNDGAAAVLITSDAAARRLGLRPRARLHAFAVAGDDPLCMLTAIVPAIRKVLDRAGLSLADIGVFEVTRHSPASCSPGRPKPARTSPGSTAEPGAHPLWPPGGPRAFPGQAGRTGPVTGGSALPGHDPGRPPALRITKISGTVGIRLRYRVAAGARTPSAAAITERG